jgi:hypothetical protein
MKTASLLVLLPTLAALAAPLGSGQASVLAKVKRAGSDVDAIRDIFVVDDEQDHSTNARVKRGAADVDAIRDIFVDENTSAAPKAKRGNGDVNAIRDIFVVDKGATSPKPKRSNGEIDAIRDIFIEGDDGDDNIQRQDSGIDDTDAWIVHKDERATLKRGNSDIDAIRDIFVVEEGDKVATKRRTSDVDAIRDIFLSTDYEDDQPNKLRLRHSSNPYANDIDAADPRAILGEK